MTLGEIKKGNTVYLYDWFNEQVVELQVKYTKKAYGNLYVNVNYIHPKTNLRIPDEELKEEYQRVLTVTGDEYYLFASKNELKKNFGDVYELQVHDLDDCYDEDDEDYREILSNLNKLYDKVQAL